jgi:hypothetical protein
MMIQGPSPLSIVPVWSHNWEKFAAIVNEQVSDSFPLPGRATDIICVQMCQKNVVIDSFSCTDFVLYGL